MDLHMRGQVTQAGSSFLQHRQVRFEAVWVNVAEQIQDDPLPDIILQLVSAPSHTRDEALHEKVENQAHLQYYSSQHHNVWPRPYNW